MDKKDLLLSVQRALFEKVTPNLRAVYLIIAVNHVELIFYLDNQPSEEEKELISEADTEFIADFPSPEYKTQFKQIIIPYPQKVPREGLCAYYRYEPHLEK